MSKKYRIKKEAVPFILEKHATSIYDRETWESLGIDIKALEEVEPPYISHGHRTSEISKDLGGWNEDGSKFLFTIHFPSTKFMEHDKFSKGRVTRKLMDKVQYSISSYFEDFLTEQNND